MKGSVRLYKWEASSFVNGPGERFVIWFQGCPFSCPGCFNRDARTFDGGDLVPLQELWEKILASGVRGVTLSGGEPFLQAKEAALLLRECGRRGIDRVVYTGFLYEELKREIFPGTRELLRASDLLLEGRYRKEIPPDGEWTGSGNQRVLALSARGMEMKSSRRTEWVEREYIISEDGETVLTGI